MNYFNTDILNNSELSDIKKWIEETVGNYPEDSIFRKKLEEDLWDINDILERDDQ